MTNESTAAKRLLWNTPAVVCFCALAMALNIGIVAHQMYLRRGILDPDWLPIFSRLYLFQDYPASLLYLPILMLALVPRMQRVGLRSARFLGDHPFAASLALLLVLGTAAKLVYLGHPLALDESAPYMQSKAFAAGALAGLFPPALIDRLVYPDFQNFFITVSHATGHVASSYWPGFAVLLTPFMLAGVPWLCNPALGALSLYVIHRLTLALTASKEAAGLAMLMSIASAAFIINAISFYSMTAHLLCNATFALLLLRPTAWRVCTAGVVGGLALVLHNPVPHMLFAAPWIFWLLIRKDRLRTIPALIAGYLPLVAVLGFGWYQQGLAIMHGPEQAGSSSAISWTLDHARALIERTATLPSVALFEARLIGAAKLWLWAAPGLLLLSVIGLWKSRSNVFLRMLAASAVLTVGGYFFVPADQGHGWGYRYFHSVWFVLPILAATAMVRSSRPAIHDNSAQPYARFVAGASVGGILLIIPFYAATVHSFIDNHLAQLPSTKDGQPHVLFISPGAGYYSQDLIQNDPFLRDPVARMVSHGRKQDEQMMVRYFPDLVLLSRDYRGSVWGRPNLSDVNASASSFLLEADRPMR